MERAVKITADYTKERTAFGKPLLEFQNTAFKLAERKTRAMIARVFVYWCVERLVAGDLDTVTASMAKWWCSEKQVETADECLQLHGGYGYMQEYPISRMFIDSRHPEDLWRQPTRFMKLLIARFAVIFRFPPNLFVWRPSGDGPIVMRESHDPSRPQLVEAARSGDAAAVERLLVGYATRI